MTIKLDLRGVFPSTRKASEAGARGIRNLIVEHLRERDRTRPKKENGMRHSGYWADAADATRVDGNVVTITKEGAALHYYGGIVYPKKNALAIPKSPIVSDQNPKEYDPSRDKLYLVWPKGKTAGVLKDKKTDAIYYLLIPKAKIEADVSVLPSDDLMQKAAMDAIMEAAS